MVEDTSGIYIIKNTLNGNFYVGSACNFRKRWNQHKSALLKNKHDNQHLQKAVNKYGIAAFSFEIICNCRPQDLIYFEQLCINLLKPVYNIQKIAGSMFGYRHSEKSKKKMSESHMGKDSSCWLGRKHSAEAKINMSKAQKIRGSNGCEGRIVSEETRKQISLKLQGCQNACGKRSAEAIKNIVEGTRRAKEARKELKNV